MSSQSFEYFDPERPWGRTYPHYSERKWRIISLGIRGSQNIHALLTTKMLGHPLVVNFDAALRGKEHMPSLRDFASPRQMTWDLRPEYYPHLCRSF